MVIAAHLSRPGPDGQSYLSALLHAQTANDRLIIFVDKKDRQNFRLPSNAVVVEINPPLKNGLLLRFWYRFKLPALLRQYQATVFFSEFPAISPETDLPQSVFIGDESMVKRPGFRRYYASTFFNNCLKAEEIFIAGNHLRQFIPQKLHHNISLLPPVLEDVYKPLSFEEKDLVQKDFAGNRDYFLLYLAPEHNQLLVTVLKGFSRFKKWQKSSFRLVIITTIPNAVAVENIISAYKYREEIHVYSKLSLTANAQLTASAFASIHLTESRIDVKALMQCAACEIPQLVQQNTSSTAIMDEAAIFFEATEEDVMRGLQEVYKNERRVADIKEKAKLILTDSGLQLTSFLQPVPPEVKL